MRPRIALTEFLSHGRELLAFEELHLNDERAERLAQDVQQVAKLGDCGCLHAPIAFTVWHKGRYGIQ